MIGKIILAGVTPAGLTVVPKKERVKVIKTLSISDCILRTVKRHNAAKGKPQWLRRVANAYERGEHGIAKVRSIGSKVFQYDVVGRLTEKLPQRGQWGL